MSFLDSTVLRCLLVSAAVFTTGCVSLPSFNKPTDADSTVATSDREANPRAQQAPGFMRMRLGAVTITALYDGAVDLGSHLLTGANQATIAQLMREGLQPSTGAQTSVNAFLIDDGHTIALIDTGAAEGLGTNTGQLRKALQASGYAPEDIQAVLLTHLHPDHVGGLLHQGVMAFPNAVVHAPQKDASYWLSEQVRIMAPDSQRGLFWAAQSAIWPYQHADRLRTFTDGPVLGIAGLQAVSMPGHTPGHSGFVLNSGNESLLLWGDVISNHTTQLANPRISVEFDTDPAQARTTRAKVLREVAQSGQWVAGSHMPFPGIGRVQASGKTSYRWLPIDYSQTLSSSAQRQP